MPHTEKKPKRMKPEEYSARAHATALYPTIGLVSSTIQDLIYPSFGLVNEFLEFWDKKAKDCSEDEVVLESGDVFWYANEICLALNIQFSDFLFTAREASSCGFVEPDEAIRACGEVTGVMKKMIRDGPSPEKTDKLLRNMATIVGCVITAQAEGNDDILIMEKNVAKLEARMAKGTIKGNGDHR